MKNKTLFLLFFFFIISCNSKDNSQENIKKILFKADKFELSSILKKYDINDFKRINIIDNNYFYLFAKSFYEKLGYNKWSDFLLYKAIKTENIFKSEALLYYIDILIENNSFESLKYFIKNNKSLFISENLDFYNCYALDKKINDVKLIPGNKNILPLLYEILKRNPNDVSNQENKIKLQKYIIDSNLYMDNTKPFLSFLKDIVIWSKYDSFLSCLYYSKTVNTNYYMISLENFFKYSQNINDDIMSIIKDSSIKMGLRKNFNKLLSDYFNRNKYFLYYFGLEQVKNRNISSGKAILTESLQYFNDKSIINYNIRYLLLQYEKSFTAKWIAKTVEFCNDYPDYYKSKLILNNIIRTALIQNKSFIVPVLNNLSEKSINALQLSIVYYNFYLLDKENKEEWKEKLIKNYPLSYASLSINDGKVPIELHEKKIDIITEKDLKHDGLYSVKKVKYLLEFDFYKEATSININKLDDKLKVSIYDLLYNYCINNGNYFDALNHASDIADILYKDNYYKIDNISLIKRLYPLHFKEFVFESAKKYNIDPAFVFAVMREESYFKKDIASNKNAMGLMQIMPATAKFISKKLKIQKYDLTNPKDNINMGVYYLSFLQKYFTQKELLLSSYNAGHGRTKKWYKTYYNKYPEKIMYEIIPIYETRHYIRKVMRSYYMYKYLIENDDLNNGKLSKN